MSISGASTTSLSIPPAVFSQFPNVDNWKVEFAAVAVYPSATLTGSSSLLFIKNRLPLNGTCSVDLNNGTAMSTYFTISCENWYDSDGTIKTYEFFGNFSTSVFKPVLKKILKMFVSEFLFINHS